jgi:hypothetical protein
MTGNTTIYISVEETSGSSWRPVDAIQRGENVYEIVGENPKPDMEKWPFNKGDFVECKPYELTDSDIILVAFAKAACTT